MTKQPDPRARAFIDPNRPLERGLWFCAGAVSLWLCALFVGWSLGGAVHLLLLVPIWFRPWRMVRR